MINYIIINYIIIIAMTIQQLQLHIDQDYLTRIKKLLVQLPYPRIYMPGRGNRSILPCVGFETEDRPVSRGRKLFRNARELAHKTG